MRPGFARDDAIVRIEATNLANWETPIATQLGEQIRHGRYGWGVPMNNSTHHRILYHQTWDPFQPIILDRNQ